MKSRYPQNLTGVYPPSAHAQKVTASGDSGLCNRICIGILKRYLTSRACLECGTNTALDNAYVTCIQQTSLNQRGWLRYLPRRNNSGALHTSFGSAEPFSHSSYLQLFWLGYRYHLGYACLPLELAKD